MKIELKAFGRKGSLFCDGLGSVKMTAEIPAEAKFLQIIEHCANGKGHNERAVLLYALSHNLLTEQERDMVKTIIDRAAPDYNKYLDGEKSK